jgi:hypothetical protein
MHTSDRAARQMFSGMSALASLAWVCICLSYWRPAKERQWLRHRGARARNKVASTVRSKVRQQVS